jgi:hypothetical protein
MEPVTSAAWSNVLTPSRVKRIQIVHFEIMRVNLREIVQGEAPQFGPTV